MPVADDVSPSPDLPGRPNKYKKIFEKLKQAIADGTYKEGQRIPSETQLSRTCGASRLTVARALKDLESLGIFERRPGSGSYVRQPPSGRRADIRATDPRIRPD